MSERSSIAFADLQTQYQSLKPEIDAGIQRVLDHGRFIMGPEVAELEAALSDFSGAQHAVTCSSGTDALLMVMMGHGISPGDAVFIPGFTFTATAEVILLLGATPVFVDVDSWNFNICTEDLSRKIVEVEAAGKLTPKAILAVDLFGLPADYDSLGTIAAKHKLHLWADAAQGFGGSIGAKKVGTLADATCLSFFPAKPLGCYGDGGAILTDDPELAEILRSIRAHGKGTAKYDIVRIGLNARMDTIQAAVLLAKLPSFAAEIERRENVAQRYDAALKPAVRTPARVQGNMSAWAQYTIQVENRDELAMALKNDGIPTAIYYPLPLHLQTAYLPFGQGRGSLPNSELLSDHVLSIPIHPYLSDSDIEHISDSISKSAAKKQ